MTRAMAEAWSPFGITCNAIAPGFVPTELTEPVFSDSDDALTPRPSAGLACPISVVNDSARIEVG